MSNSYDLFGKELLTSRIGVSAFPHMGSLVLNYIHVGTSTELLYLFRNEKNRHIAIIATKELLTSRIGMLAFPHIG